MNHIEFFETGKYLIPYEKVVTDVMDSSSLFPYFPNSSFTNSFVQAYLALLFLDFPLLFGVPTSQEILQTALILLKSKLLQIYNQQ